MEQVTGYFDGGCGPNNPGGYGTYGVVVRKGNEIILRESGYIGCGPQMSNNVAEYAGIIKIFQFLIREQISKAVIYGDSKLVVKQMNGLWRLRGGLYLNNAKEALSLRRQLPGVQVRWIPREKNREADSLARKAFPSQSLKELKRHRKIAELVRQQRADQRDTARRIMNKIFL